MKDNILPPPHMIMITGGQRSGKSRIAEQMVESMSSNPLYLATALVLDDEMEARVEAHRKRRGQHWDAVESPYHPSMVDMKGRTVLLDCLTMLANNWFFQAGEDIEIAYKSVANELEGIVNSGASTVVVVTNEIGLGGVSPNSMTLRFTDLQGRLNTLLAQKSDKVILCVSSIPVTIK